MVIGYFIIIFINLFIVYVSINLKKLYAYMYDVSINVVIFVYKINLLRDIKF